MKQRLDDIWYSQQLKRQERVSDLSVLNRLVTLKIDDGRSQPETHGYFRPSFAAVETFTWTILLMNIP